MPKRPADWELASAVTSPGFTPRASDLDALFELLARDEQLARHAERALARLGVVAARAAVERFDTARPALRSRLCQLVGRIAVDAGASELDAFLEARLGDSDKKTQRRAIQALGKTKRSLDALFSAWDGELAVEERRVLATALGKSADERAYQRLDELRTSDPELGRIRDEARLVLGAELSRASAGEIDVQSAPPERLEITLHCRHGLERFVCEELPPELEARVIGPGRVAATLRASLDTLFASRTALGFGIPLASLRPARDSEELAAMVADAIASEHSVALLKALTRGAPRYRIEWASAGRRRALSQRVAQRVLRSHPDLLNDPRGAAWQVVVEERARRLYIELQPRRLDDPRFSYRRRLLPAASHPTIAAALARVAGVRADDVVWDPFVGTATELIERAKLGPYRSLYGSDVDRAALDAARENLRAAAVEASLALGDARRHRPSQPPTLVLTNPPLGRRMLRREGVAELLHDVVAHVAELLAGDGRVVWISPLPEASVRDAVSSGLAVTLRQRVDMGGFQAELQRFERATPRRRQR